MRLSSYRRLHAESRRCTDRWRINRSGWEAEIDIQDRLVSRERRGLKVPQVQQRVIGVFRVIGADRRRVWFHFFFWGGVERLRLLKTVLPSVLHNFRGQWSGVGRRYLEPDRSKSFIRDF